MNSAIYDKKWEIEQIQNAIDYFEKMREDYEKLTEREYFNILSRIEWLSILLEEIEDSINE